MPELPSQCPKWPSLHQLIQSSRIPWSLACDALLVEKRALLKKNGKLHALIWASKDNAFEVERLRREVAVNTRRMQEIEHLVLMSE